MKQVSFLHSRDSHGATGAAVRRPRAFGAAALKTALLVGTTLTLINHPQVLQLELTPDLLAPCLLNYLVPFLVAGYSRHGLLGQIRTHRGDG